MDKTAQSFTIESIMDNSNTENWTEAQWNKFHAWLKSMLTVNDELKVTFTKVDGTDRVMRCTLNPNYLPKVELVEGKKERKKPEDTLAVFDLDKNEWRSFKIRSVKEVRFML